MVTSSWGMLSVQGALWMVGSLALIGDAVVQMSWAAELLNGVKGMIGGETSVQYLFALFAVGLIAWLLVLWFRPGLEVLTKDGDRLFLRLKGFSRTQAFQAKTALDAALAGTRVRAI